MNNKDIKEQLIKAIEVFIIKDWEELYKNNIHENTFSHRIAVYLEKIFSQYNVDCEYNKTLGNNKLNEIGGKIRPDIIVHRRGSMSNNKLIIEVKKAGSESLKCQKDLEKLKKISNLYYDLGVVVGVLKNTIDIVFIESGNEEKKTFYKKNYKRK